MKAKRSPKFYNALRSNWFGLMTAVPFILLLVMASVLATGWQLERWQAELLVMVGLTTLVLAALPWES